MTNKEAVRKIDPAASAQPGRVLESFPVQVASWRIVGYDGAERGVGNTEDAAWLDAAVRMGAPTVYDVTPAIADVIINAILVGCTTGEFDPGDNYPGARASRPGALRSHITSEVQDLLSRFKASPTR